MKTREDSLIKQAEETAKAVMGLGEELKNMEALKYSKEKKGTIIQECGDYYETDSTLVKGVLNIAELRSSFLASIPSADRHLSDQQLDEIDFRARLHSEANRYNLNTAKPQQKLRDQDKCLCGCRRAKGPLVSPNVPIRELASLGPGVVLQFTFFKGLGIIFMMAVIIYGLYGTIMHFKGTNADIRKCQGVMCLLFLKGASDNLNQEDAASVRKKLQWMGLVVCLLVGMILLLMRYLGKKIDHKVDEDLSSASDTAVKIENLPYGQYTEKELIRYFQQLEGKAIDRHRSDIESEDSRQKNSESEQSEGQNESIYDESNPFNLKGIQIIYNMSQARNLIGNIINTSISIKELLQKVPSSEFENFSFFKQQRQKVAIKYLTHLGPLKSLLKDTNCQSIQNFESIRLPPLHFQHKQNRKISQAVYRILNLAKYRKLKQTLTAQYESLGDMRKAFNTSQAKRRSLATTCCIIDFHTEKDQHRFLKIFGHQKYTLLQRATLLIVEKFCDAEKITFKGQALEIERAPEPTDILWTNCEYRQNSSNIQVSTTFFRYSLTRIMAIHTVTFFVIMLSFSAIVGLVSLRKYVGQQQFQNSYLNQAISLLVGLSLQVTNKILWMILGYSLEKEYNHTVSEAIISQMNNSLMAISVNSIGVPLFSSFVLGLPIFGEEGLAGMALNFHVSMIFITLPLRFINPKVLLMYILLRIKKIRNFILKLLVKKVPQNLSMGIESINELYTFPRYAITETYIFLMTIAYHGVFFSQLQPIILIFVLVEISIAYISCKIILLRYSTIPEMVDLLVFKNAISQANLIPIIYTAGSIILSHLEFYAVGSKFGMFYTPSYGALAFGILCFVNPGGILNKFVEYFANRPLIKKIFQLEFSKECKNAIKKLRREERNSKRRSHRMNTFFTNKSEKEDIVTRKDTYYECSNSLALIGFEAVLMGVKSMESQQNELRRYCEQFFAKNTGLDSSTINWLLPKV